MIAKLLDLAHRVVVDGDAFFADALLGKHFLFAVRIDAILTLCLGRLAQRLQVVGQVLLDRLGVAEDLRIDGNEAVADAAGIRAAGCVRRRAHREYRGEDLADHRIAVTLVAAELLGAAAERHDAAAGVGVDVAQHVRRVGGRLAVLIERPALRQGLAHLVVDFQFAARDDGRCRVKEEIVRLRRHGDGNRVRAEHGFLAERRHHDRFGVRAGDTD